MSALEGLRDAIPEPARDLKLNLQAVLAESSLSAEQRWGVAVACAIASRNPRLPRGGARRRARRGRARPSSRTRSRPRPSWG